MVRVDLDRKLRSVPCALAVSIVAFASAAYALNDPPSQVGRLTFTPEDLNNSGSWSNDSPVRQRQDAALGAVRLAAYKTGHWS